MTVLAMAKAILFATACCFCCRAAQTNKPANQHKIFNHINMMFFNYFPQLPRKGDDALNDALAILTRLLS